MHHHLACRVSVPRPMTGCIANGRRPRAAALVAAALGMLAIAFTVPAHGSTNVSVTLLAGPLSLSEPSSANLGSATSSISGTSITGHLGTTTITDTRASLAGWTATISASNFSDGAS